MGAVQGRPVSNVNQAKNDTTSLEKGILAMASKLYKQYHPKMRDVDLCQQIGLVSADKLDQFDSFTLKKISDKQNSGKVTLKPVYISRDSNQGAKFEIEGMSKLDDFFMNKYISIPEGLENKKELDVPYLSNLIFDILNKRKENILVKKIGKNTGKTFQERIIPIRAGKF